MWNITKTTGAPQNQCMYLDIMPKILLISLTLLKTCKQYNRILSVWVTFTSQFSQSHTVLCCSPGQITPIRHTRILYCRVQKTHHKFMRASYMKHFAKFLAILHHNASFFNFCFIINFGFIKNLLHIFDILKLSLSEITLLLNVTAW